MQKLRSVLISSVLAWGVWSLKPSTVQWPRSETGLWFRPESGAAVWATYGWWSLVLAVVIAGLLVAFRRHWMDPRPEDAEPKKKVWSTNEKWALIAVVAVSVAVRLPALQHPVQRDEQDNLATQVVGSWHLAPIKSTVFQGAWDNLDASPENLHRMLRSIDLPGSNPRWKQPRWIDTLYLNWIGNNSAPNSVLSRASNRIWQLISGAEPQRFNVVAIRLPAFLVATAAVMLFFFLVRQWLDWQRALLASILLALHPLHIQFGILSRGYALMLLALLLSLSLYERGSCLRARWRQVFGGALALAFALWAFPGMAYAAPFLLALFFLRALKNQSCGRWLVFKRWSSAHLAAFACWLPVGLPMLVQSGFAVTHNYPRHSDSPWWMTRFWAQGLTGLEVPTVSVLPYGAKASDLPAGLLGRLFAETPAAAMLLIAVAVVLVLGIWRLSRLRPIIGASMIALGGGAALACLLHFLGSGRELLPWYSFFLAPMLPLAMAALWTPESRSPQRWIIPMLAIVLVIVTFPDHRKGRLRYFPPAPFDVISWNHFGARIVSDRSGRSVTF